MHIVDLVRRISHWMHNAHHQWITTATRRGKITADLHGSNTFTIFTDNKLQN